MNINEFPHVTLAVTPDGIAVKTNINDPFQVATLLINAATNTFNQLAQAANPQEPEPSGIVTPSDSAVRASNRGEMTNG